MYDIFEEYGGVIVAVSAAVIIIIALGVFFSESGFFSDWIASYAASLGG